MIHKHFFVNSYSSNGRKEVNVLFNNALNTFYLWLYGIRPLYEPSFISLNVFTPCSVPCVEATL